MKPKLLLLLLLLVGKNVYSQFTAIPDTKFEAKLIALGFDDIADGKILTSEAHKIKSLNIRNSSISDLTGIQDFISLTYLNCDGNLLTSLDVSKNTSLTNLQCHNNKINSFDISNNPNLTTFYCNNNLLTNLNLKNGKNTLLNNVTFGNNPALYCISVDDIAYANTNWIDKKDPHSFFSSYDCSSTTLIPNGLFEDKLIALGIDTDGKNGLVLNSSIATLTSLDVSNSSLTDLTGLEGFKSLITLNCSNNLLSTIDLSKNTALTTLDCSNNPTLTCIQVADITYAMNNWTTIKDVTANFNLDCKAYTLIPDANFEAKLIALGIDNISDGKVETNKIKTLKLLNVYNSLIVDLTGIQDFVSLTELRCESNQITSLDISKNTALINLNISDNKLNSITLNTTIKSLNCDNNKLKVLDLSKNTALTNLYVGRNLLTSLDVSEISELKQLECYQNTLSTLDISKNIALNYLNCNSNILTTLNLKNGNNTLLKNLDFSWNYDLSCVIVDDVEYANTNWKKTQGVDFASFFPYDCSIITVIPNAVFEDKLIALGIDTDGKNGVVLNSSIETLTTLDISNSSLTDVTGLEGFKTLTSLNVSNNSLNSINLSKNLALTNFDCSNNATLTCIQVADIDLAKKNLKTTPDEAITNFNLDCRVYTLIPDAKFEAKLIDEGFDDIADGKVLTSKINKIKSLEIPYSGIKDLTGIQDFVALIYLNCYSNELTSLDVSKNTALTQLNSYSNQITSLYLSKNTELRHLDCSNNKLTSLDISQCPFISYLRCNSNQLTTLDVKANSKLYKIDCFSNKLNDLDISKNAALQFLQCYSNQITSLDVSKNTALLQLKCNSNKLTTLNLKNGKNSNLSSLSINENPYLHCIVVDDIDYANTNWSSYKNKYASFSNFECSTVTVIPNGFFEDKLIGLGIDTDGKNGFVLNSSIETLTSLDVSNSGLTNLTGLEGFKALKTLNCSNNILNTINLSKNSSLTTLNCAKNVTLTCIQVADISAANSWTTTKDATATFSLDCRPYTLIPDTNFEAKLITLGFDDIADGKVLTTNINTIQILELYNSSISDLTGIQDFTALTRLSCSYNKLTSLDVSKNLELTELDCTNNQITTLNINENTKFTHLLCSDNQITSLDVSKNTKLIILYCDKNKLTHLNLKNGNNTEFFIYNFTNNPTLSCIGVDDADYSNTKWSSYKDRTAVYSTYDCSTVTGIPDPKFEDKLIALGIDTDGKNSLVLNSSIETVITLDVSNNSISSLSGIQGFTALTNLNSSNNLLTNIDLSKNLALTDLNCSSNQLTSFDIGLLTSLTKLDVSSNQLTTLDVTKNTALNILDFNENQIISIDLTKHKTLTQLFCASNQLTSLNISKNTALTDLNCSSNQLVSLNLKNGNNSNFNSSTINLKNNPNLSCIKVDDKTYSDTNWTNYKDANSTFNNQCGLSLASNNFTVITKGESCLGENNGEINIAATETFSYTASINGNAIAFNNNSLNVADLTPGEYTISITIAGEAFEQNFNVTIAKGGSISGKSSISSKKMNIEITEGTAPFTIFVDGTEQFQTTDSNFDIEVKQGGLIEVATAKACEGVFSKKITTFEIGGVLSAYPNPTHGDFEIEIPINKTEVKIELYNIVGQLISDKMYKIENGKAKLNLENKSSGIYAAKIYLNTPEYIKIIKK